MGVRARDQDAADAMSSGLAVFTFAIELEPQLDDNTSVGTTTLEP